MNLSFGKKKGIATSEANIIEIQGLEVSHLGSKDVVFISGTTMVGDQLYKTGIGVGVPADPQMIDDLIKSLEKLKKYLTVRHVR